MDALRAEMREDGGPPDAVCFNAAIGAAAGDHDAEKALALLAQIWDG